MDLRAIAEESGGSSSGPNGNSGTSSSSHIGMAPSVGSGLIPYSSSAPSTFNGFQQFQQQSLDEPNSPRRSTSGFDENGQNGGINAQSDGINDNGSAEVSLTSRLNAFRLKDIGCDVAFIVGEEKEQLKAHKLVLGASSAVFYAMFYGPLSVGVSTAGISAGGPAEIPQIVQQAPSERSASSQSQAPAVTSPAGQAPPVEESEYDEEEYEEDEYEEAEAQEEETENMSGDGSSFSNSLNSSMDGEQHHLHHNSNSGGAAPQIGAITAAVSRRFNGIKDSSQKCHPHLHHPQQFPFDGKRRFSNGFQHTNNGSPKLGQKTVQALQDPHDLQRAAELAAKGLQAVYAPDCEPKAFAILLDFLYSDSDVKALSARGQLTDEHVMNTLYAAKKYALDALVAECVHYCTARLTAANAVPLLAQARLFDEHRLVEQCFQVIDQHTDVALQAANVADIDRDTLITVLGRSQMDPSSELVIFNAAKAWADAECTRRGIVPTVENLRQCLGPAMQLIRFSLMDVNEFGVAASSSLLTCEEIAEVFLHLTVRPRPKCRFAARGFRAHSRSKHIVQRFSALSSKRCTRRENKICFTADRDVLISGLAIYGANQSGSRMIPEETGAKTNWEHRVAIKLESVADLYGSPLELLASNELALSGKIGDPTPFVASFVEPVACSANTTYLVTARFMTEEGVSTFQGKEGQAVVTVELPFDQTVRFKFQAWRNGLWNDDGGRTEGQIPALHFLVQWPEEGNAEA